MATHKKTSCDIFIKDDILFKYWY